MRRLHARKGMALAMLPALLLAAGGCTKTPVAPVSREAAALTWTIVDEAGGVGRGDFTGKAVTAVFSALDTPPVITYLTGDQSLLVSRMLALDELPDLLTVPAGGALRSKIIGSGRVWNIRELSETLADSLPEDIRCAYQNNSGELFSLPGGYTAQGYRPVATEGLYVRQEYASLLGNPAMDTPEKFARALEAFVRLATENRLIGSDELLPVVFGEENRGLATVEHICGVLPLYRDGESSYHRIFSPKIQEVMRFFDRLDGMSVYRIFEAYSADRLAELLKANVFAYIGPAAFIERFNLENPRLRYVPAAPPFAADGYLEAQSRLGCFETFVSMDCDRATAAALLETLSSREASRTFLYGVEDENWVLVDGEVTPLKSTRDSIRANTLEFLRQTGIASFPFLSRDGALNPYMPTAGERARDIAGERVYFSPADYHGYYVAQMDKRLAGYYAEVAGASVSAADIAARIKALEPGKEPLTVSR